MNDTVPDIHKYKTFWRRLGALFLDGGALAPLKWLEIFIWNSTANPFVLLTWAVFQSFATLAYSILFVAKFGQTPGKMACGVKIFGVQGEAVTLKQAVLREIVPVLSMLYFLFIQVQHILGGQLVNRAMGDISVFNQVGIIVFGWFLLEVITMLTNKKRRAIHDFIASTVVMREAQNTKLLWLPWLLIVLLLLLNTITPHLIEDKNIVIEGKPLFKSFESR